MGQKPGLVADLLKTLRPEAGNLVQSKKPGGCYGTTAVTLASSLSRCYDLAVQPFVAQVSQGLILNVDGVGLSGSAAMATLCPPTPCSLDKLT